MICLRRNRQREFVQVTTIHIYIARLLQGRGVDYFLSTGQIRNIWAQDVSVDWPQAPTRICRIRYTSKHVQGTDRNYQDARRIGKREFAAEYYLLQQVRLGQPELYTSQQGHKMDHYRRL